MLFAATLALFAMFLPAVMASSVRKRALLEGRELDGRVLEGRHLSAAAERLGHAIEVLDHRAGVLLDLPLLLVREVRRLVLAVVRLLDQDERRDDGDDRDDQERRAPTRGTTSVGTAAWAARRIRAADPS